MTTVYDFSAPLLDGTEQPLDSYRGQVLLIVNTASRCGLTPQYQGLQALQERYQAQGFTVLGFPCNQFRNQEPGSADDIAEFCDTRYAVRFPVFDKVEVNGDGAHPLWQYLVREAPGVLGSRRIKWNFTKFLIGRDGKVLHRYAPIKTPDSLVADIEAALKR
ncbi:glutathione peroxidase [Isoalcanivorax beigongshangi]|uniref:Glutathione peroxidase n=1 Tax=Isoalcanivorax beigongshangi TaxID=3238810 RepID=A0ABV4AE91_9GAMM